MKKDARVAVKVNNETIAKVKETNYSFFLADSLEKVFLSKCPTKMKTDCIDVIPGETPAVQLVYSYHPDKEVRILNPKITINVEGAPVKARLRFVENIAADYPVTMNSDDNYISKEPGLFPDLLAPMKDNYIAPVYNQYRAIWIDFPNIKAEYAGEYKVEIIIETEEVSDIMGAMFGIEKDEKMSTKLSFKLNVLPVALKEQTTMHTEWIHIDSLCDYYKVDAFSDKHWQQIENTIETAVKEHAVNMILTPIFTLALNTAYGAERTTTQLIDVALNNGEYTFGFDRLNKWCQICKKHNVKYLEISHFFSQWGAKFAAKVIANVNGEEKRIFGWDTLAVNDEYAKFLKALIPQLIDNLKSNGYDKEFIRFHISDEPMAKFGHTQSYLEAKNIVSNALSECVIIDALSDFSLYERGIIDCPVPTSDHYHDFHGKVSSESWVYYCTAQSVKVPNRFVAMPSARSLVMGVLMYVYDIKGFLHWGYNYYSDAFSAKKQNPYWQTSCDKMFQSGDAYLVYPSDDGKALSSIRAEIVRRSFDDIRAMQLLESYIGREEVLSLIKLCVGEIDFFNYPTSLDKLNELHSLICKKIIEVQ